MSSSDFSLMLHNYSIFIIELLASIINFVIVSMTNDKFLTLISVNDANCEKL